MRREKAGDTPIYGNSKRCGGCLYAFFVSGKYMCCDAYLMTKGAVRPQWNKRGVCLSKKPGVRARVAPEFIFSGLSGAEDGEEPYAASACGGEKRALAAPASTEADTAREK
ncbi:MAG: hypothetical protein AB7D36_07785 [Oscillospiraceae bacterium]